jgi:transposase
MGTSVGRRRSTDRVVPSTKEDVMGPTVIGVDPHKRSHTAVVLDDDEEIAAQLRIAADRRQLDRLLGWVSDWPERIWAVENVNGLGRLLSQQLVLAGEQVVDVPASLAHRTRKLSGKSGRETDEHDARSDHDRGFPSGPAADRGARGLLPGARADPRSPQASGLLPASHHLPAARAALGDGPRWRAEEHHSHQKGQDLAFGAARHAGRDRTTRDGQQLLDDWRWCNRRIPAVETRLHEALQAHGSTLTTIFGIGDISAATILAIVGDFPSAWASGREGVWMRPMEREIVARCRRHGGSAVGSRVQR